MRTVTTCHTDCIREIIDPSRTAQRALNVKYLLRLLQYTHDSGRGDGGTGGSKKRAASSEPGPSRRRRKRFKKVDATALETDNPDDEDDTQEQPTNVPVYCHTFDIGYTRFGGGESVAHDFEAEALGWDEEEDSLIKWLDGKRREPEFDTKEEWSMDIPGINLNTEASGLAVYIDGSYDRLMQLPLVDTGFKVEDHDMRHMHLRDPLMALFVLQDAGRIDLSAELRVSTVAAGDATMLPFRITLRVVVSLLCPTIFDPVVYTTKAATSEVEEAQRRALSFIFPPAPRDPLLESEVNIPTLYAIIGPAPPLDPPSLEVKYQPAALLPTLLPFQRRTVAWLLSRERKALDADESVVDRQAPLGELPLFWQTISITLSDGREEIWYLNNVTGEVSAVRPEQSDPPGGILAEEPGLGKTLESIALVLLNPAVDRNPTQKVWNPDARIYTKKIKTTLIVTPTALAQQWGDELKLHAPGLKVLVYEGWQKLKVPITESDLALALHEKAQASRKLKAREQRTALAAAKAPSPALATASKSSNAKGKGKAKAQLETKPDAMDVDTKTDRHEEAEKELVDWCNYVNQFDVCITTYNVLQQDFGIARPPPDRPRRSIATYINIERSRSPLVMCEWYRVIMDEVQMVGGGKTEEMVSLLPRLSSFAVSGTPARSQVADLIHVLNFLRIKAVTKDPRVWGRLLKPGYSDQLLELFLRYAVRTMKVSVRDELTIPKQTRFLVPIELGRIEQHVYNQNFEKALLELGFDARGVAVAENWQVDVGTLRGWLRKLRGICTHPQVGQLQNQADKLHRPGVLKTIGEVLESMRDQNWRNLMEDRRSKVQVLTIIAQLYHHHEKHHNRYQIALDTLLKAERETCDLIDDVQAALDVHEEEGKRLKVEAADPGGLENETPEANTLAKGKGKARADGNYAEEEDDLPRNAAGEEHRVKRRAFQQRLRECQITLHKVCFLKGDVYHVLGNTEEETSAYEKAEALRRVLLRSTEEAAERAMTQLLSEMGERRLTEKDLHIEVPYCGAGGIRSSALLKEANEIIDELLNQQSALLWKWRSHLIQVLTRPLTSGDDNDADGQEYARSLETQGEAEAYLQAYSALLADRREVMTAERTLLAIVDVKEKKTRKTKAAKRAAMALHDDMDLDVILADVEAQPEDEVLRKELHEQRKALLEDHDPQRAVRSVMVELSNIAAGITRENDPEKIIAYEAAQQLRELIANQGKLLEKLQADLGRLRKAFNERIQYFRQLQELSDTVAEAAWEGSVIEAIQEHDAHATELGAKINTNKARQRYLEFLAKSQGEGTLDEEEESCILCKCDFERGYITQCAHVFCEECMKAWLLRKEGKTCPVCRVAIHPDQMQRFVIGQKANSMDTPAKLVNNEPAPKTKRRIEYNIISPGVFKSIESMECNGSYGSKIQTLVRHLLYLQIIEPGAKSIVFSAWADSLLIIEHALQRNSISCIRIDQSKGKQNAAKRFKSDPSIEVLLLHGERENAGLNVTCASRVFLVESVVHHAFEIQAIARIDRMGQSRPTEVFCYYAEDTVERNILDLAARRGQCLYTTGNAAGTLTAGPITAPEKKSIDAPKKRAQKGDFVFKTDDMLAIFFPHLFEDIEYLISDDSQDRVPAHDVEKPIAGPSRLA